MTIAAPIVVGRGGGRGVLFGHVPQGPTREKVESPSLEYHQHPLLLALWDFPKIVRVNVTCKTMSPVAMPDLFMRTFTFSTSPYFEKKPSIRSWQVSTGTP